jgi:hypothetical protein
VSTAIGATTADMHRCSVTVSHELMLREEEFTDLSLMTFHIFEKESRPRPGARISAGCGACGASLYSNQPAYSPPVSGPSPRAGRPTHSYVNTPKRLQIPKCQNQNTSRAAGPKAVAPTKSQNTTQHAQPELEGLANQSAGQQAQPEVASPVTNAPN